MFTGIVHKTAEVLDSCKGPVGLSLTLRAFADDYRLGESIAVNGVCLTVAALRANEVSFDVIVETLRRTNLPLLKSGDLVHVERSLRVGDPIDGHFVQGHVDDVGKLVAIEMTDDEQWRLRIEAPHHFAKYLVPKGSIAIDGVSLTLAKVEGDQFEVALIPTTLQLTLLGKKQVGYLFNLEADMMAKTIISYLERIRGQADHG